MRRIAGIFAVFMLSTVAWLVLAGVADRRDSEQTSKLRGSVQSLWGNPQVQSAPNLTFRWTTEEIERRIETKDGKVAEVLAHVTMPHQEVVQLAASDLDVSLHSDLRRKGLAWYSLYDVGFRGEYRYVHRLEQAGTLDVGFAFPDANAIYDDFELTLNGQKATMLAAGTVAGAIAVQPGDQVRIVVHYKSRGLDSWQYAPMHGVGQLEQFSLRMHTDFAEIDFPSNTLSPSHKTRTDKGWDLVWDFKQIVTGNGIGMVMPHRIQPGALAAELSLSAPISLFFFFFVLFVLATLRNIDIHPLNYLLIAGAFFAFHLLFAYSVDHLPVEGAFALSSAVSVFLVVSYLRLVVSSRFAYVEAGLAQVVYLVGFSLAHFWEGFTGLTTSVLATLTLYVLMQLTGRVQWSEVLGRKPVVGGRMAIGEGG